MNIDRAIEILNRDHHDAIDDWQLRKDRVVGRLHHNPRSLSMLEAIAIATYYERAWNVGGDTDDEFTALEWAWDNNVEPGARP